MGDQFTFFKELKSLQIMTRLKIAISFVKQDRCLIDSISNICRFLWLNRVVIEKTSQLGPKFLFFYKGLLIKAICSNIILNFTENKQILFCPIFSSHTISGTDMFLVANQYSAKLDGGVFPALCITSEFLFYMFQ